MNFSQAATLCQEMFFLQKEIFYAVSVRGATSYSYLLEGFHYSRSISDNCPPLPHCTPSPSPPAHTHFLSLKCTSTHTEAHTVRDEAVSAESHCSQCAWCWLSRMLMLWNPIKSNPVLSRATPGLYGTAGHFKRPAVPLCLHSVIESNHLSGSH